MTTSNITSENASLHHGKRTLQRLRREAGYRSACEFAEILNIPASAYCCYESQPDGPDKTMPLAVAWAIADTFGCTIDLVVGREDIDAPRTCPLQAAYNNLSITSKLFFDEFLRYLQYRDAPIQE